MISYFCQISSFYNIISLPLHYCCIPRAEVEAGNACSAWILESSGFQKFWGEEVQKYALLSSQGGSLTKTCHNVIAFPFLFALGQTQIAWAKLSLGALYLLLTLPSKTAPMLGWQGLPAATGDIPHFSSIVSWVAGQWGESHGTASALLMASTLFLLAVTWLQFRCLHHTDSVGCGDSLPLGVILWSLCRGGYRSARHY